MINAAEIDSRGRLDGKVGRVTRETIGRHINVPPEDIVTMDVSNYEGDSNHLRHMVVVDHVHKKVVLSIRGTFSLEEIVIDVAAMSREFCGGEGHSGMVDMAERVWKVAGPTLKNTIRENPGYEVIFTGHSLGGGKFESKNPCVYFFCLALKSYSRTFSLFDTLRSGGTRHNYGSKQTIITEGTTATMLYVCGTTSVYTVRICTKIGFGDDEFYSRE